jgi:hypothetical protein
MALTVYGTGRSRAFRVLWLLEEPIAAGSFGCSKVAVIGEAYFASSTSQRPAT